jgi:hypothetical protein
MQHLTNISIWMAVDRSIVIGSTSTMRPLGPNADNLVRSRSISAAYHFYMQLLETRAGDWRGRDVRPDLNDHTLSW